MEILCFKFQQNRPIIEEIANYPEQVISNGGGVPPITHRFQNRCAMGGCPFANRGGKGTRFQKYDTFEYVKNF